MRIGKGLASGTLLLLICAGAAFGDLHPIPISGTETNLTLLDRDPNGMRFRVEIGELTAMDVETEDGTFSRLMIPGFHSSKIVGSPELPMMNRLFEIPYRAGTRIEILSVESRTVRLADFGIVHPLMPAQPSMPKNVDPEDWPFIYDRDAYLTDRVGQELVRIQGLGRLRAVDIGRVEVSPVEYLPKSGEIVVHGAIEFRLRFDGADHAAGEALKASLWSPYFEPVYEMIDGYDAFEHSTHPDVVDDVVTYVIITPAAFEAQIQNFVGWKKERGFITVVGVIGSPEVGTTSATIQSYIHNLYNSPPAGQPAPSFVLFVGDVADCPTWTMSGDATDRPYCDVEGDLVPDIYYGRFSATNSTQLQYILDKTLMYDRFTMPDPSYLGNVTLIAGVDASWAPTHGNGQINYGTEHYFNAAHGIYSNTYLYPASDAPGAPAEIVQTVSSGVAFINYTAHGSQTSWSDPSFTQSNVNGLTNSGKYCLAIGNCCLTSSYEIGECFAETWIRAEDKGGIGYIGGSNNTYWDEDYWWGVGYHPSSQIDGTAWPYESTGMGAYDGLFHDHGEAMENWYVCNDAIVFSGNLAVMESGSTRTTYYWNIYNLMGDPSISTYLGVPGTNPVAHVPTIFTTTPSFTVDAAVGSYCGLTQNGEVVGAGTVGETGQLELVLWDILTPGSARLVVMAQNMEPYIQDIPVIVPATITIDPDTINATQMTDIVVTVLEADGITPKPGIDVWADGLGYVTTPVTTDAAGVCTLTVVYPFGPSLDIVGKDPAETWTLFTESVTVVASPLTAPDLWVTTSIGLSDTFALNLEGTLNMSVGDDRPGLWAIMPDGSEVQGTGASMSITPAELGEITGVIAVKGCDLYTEAFPIIEAYGTLVGHVDASGEPAIGAVVRGYDAGDALVFEATTNASGNYDVGEDVLVASYTIRVDFFGYLPYETTYFVNYGPNTCDINLTAAPSGVLTGTVADDSTGQFLMATIKVHRSDTMELYAQTVSDSIDGTYTTPSLPYFDYTVTVKAWHYKSLTIAITVEEPVVVKDFVLEATVGDLLLIDDNSKTARFAPAKLDEKTGAVVSEAYVSADPDKAAADIVADLQELGYEVTLETMSGTDPLTWENYDLLIVSSGANISTLGSASFRAALVDYVNTGAPLLVEGGEVGYDWYGDAAFANTVLRITDWDADSSGDVTVAEPAHFVMSVPNTITGPISMSYSGYGDEDANDPVPEAVKIGSWTSYPINASVIAHDTNPAPEGGQFVFFCFNYSAMAASDRALLLENAVSWLMTPEYGNCSVSGTVNLLDQGDHSGVRVEASPGGGYTYTGPGGDYSLTGLFSGTYNIIASKENWATSAQEVTLSDGQDLTGIDFVLTPVATTEMCEVSNLGIPDNYPAGVRDTCVVPLSGVTVRGAEVFIDLTHTYIGDLIITLTSPGGTMVTLHNRSGSSTDNLFGWYPGDLDPAGDLNDFIGDPAGGAWIIHVSDNAGIDTGVLNNWCVRLTHDVVATDVKEEEGGVPRLLTLKGNVPNPFNPTTTIHFDLPRASEVRLSIYDLSGRRVATLLSGPVEAGSHGAAWMGRDDTGRPVASGVYFYRLEAENKVMTRKMVLLK